MRAPKRGGRGEDNDDVLKTANQASTLSSLEVLKSFPFHSRTRANLRKERGARLLACHCAIAHLKGDLFA